MLVGILLSPVTAQGDTLGDIECTSLRVVDKDGKQVALLEVNSKGGQFNLFGKETLFPAASISVNDFGGGSLGLSTASKSGARFESTTEGGVAASFDENGNLAAGSLCRARTINRVW